MKQIAKDLTIRRRVGVELVETFQYAYDRSQEFFLQYGLTSKQYNILSILNSTEGPVSTSAILKLMVEKNAGVSRLVDRLISKKWVKKTTNSTDKRLIDIQLTKEGRALYDIVTTNLHEVDKVYDGLTDEEALQFCLLLKKVRKPIP
ncbi:MAG: MarR family transcriptional regulator [Sphingobacterium sp.]|jgi:DNA-binding MarR family transcriptional regulator|nr:MarR family transcriptional regulator [Sphingobacterium sp.]